MDTWAELLDSMPIGEYIERPSSPATMRALLSRRLVKQDDSGKWARCQGAKAYIILHKVLASRDFACIWTEDRELGMLVSRKGHDILDCWGNPYMDYSNITKVSTS